MNIGTDVFSDQISKCEVKPGTNELVNPGLYYNMHSHVSLEAPRPVSILNPDKETRDNCLKEIDLLDGKCPMKVLNNDADELCPCDEFIRSGKCVYGLFVKKEEE